jgi:hypothetical protein
LKPSVSGSPRRSERRFVKGRRHGPAQREAGRPTIAGLDGDLEMDKLPHTGLLTTDSRYPATFVTESAPFG